MLRRAILIAILLSSGLAVPVPASAATVDGGYRAVIRRTSYGVPHVLADSLGNVAFGQGWAYGEDRFCDLADQVVKVRGERSRWFGAGPDAVNLASDLAYASLGLVDRAREQNSRLDAEERQILDGYVRGFNAYFAATGRDRLPGWCRGQPWTGPVTAVDVLAYQRDLALLASGNALILPIGFAQPPGAAAAPPAATTDRLRSLLAGGGPGSNAWALGADRSSTGKGMLLANPHFPWERELRFWESHLTVPGRLNVYGGSLGGLPGVQIGFTDRVAWSHTVAEGSRFTLYSVTLVPGDPTAYLVDGRPERMVAKPVTVRVGSDLVTRTMWWTRYGPVLDLSSADPSLGWTAESAITYRDANLDNDRMLRQWFTIARAADVNGVRDALARDQGIPWVNTIAADSKGNAFYADPSQTPNLSPASIAEYLGNPLGLLDGSNSANAWVAVPGARSPGLVPFSAQPQLLRRDYVFNANDSHWFANEHRLLTGYSPLQGLEGQPLTVRTRQNLRLINSVDRFTLPGLGAAILSNSTLPGDELAAFVVAACRARGTTPVVVDGTPVVLTPACTALAGWDRRFDITSRGAVLWRETITSVLTAYPTAMSEAGPLFGVPFNPADPGRTPRGVPADATPLLDGLARALLRLQSLGLDPSVPLGAVQYTLKGGERIPIHGATEEMGIANMVMYEPAPGTSLEPVIDGGTPLPGTDLTDRGYVINYGTSLLLTVAYTAGGPVARGVLTFGQSADPASPHFADQTRLFSRKELRDCRFTEASILGDPNLRVTVVVAL